jgi:hypothetical protein
MDWTIFFYAYIFQKISLNVFRNERGCTVRKRPAPPYPYPATDDRFGMFIPEKECVLVLPSPGKSIMDT